MATHERPAVGEVEHEYSFPLTMATTFPNLIRCPDMKLYRPTSPSPRTWSPARSRALPYGATLVLLCASSTNLATGTFGHVPN